ncbi:MAG: hypothetical protein J6W05_05730 [Prevotella sp.]|nr:hypothetical protein [Prevotella sp.]
MKRTIEMILMTLLIVLAAVFVGSTLMSCSSSSDEESEQGGTTDKYGLVLYDNPTFANATPPQAYSNMTPNTQAPYRLFVMPNDEEGKAIIRQLAEDKDMIIGSPEPFSYYTIEGGYFITSKKYFENPHLYVSVNYMMEGMESMGYVVHVAPFITIKMKEGHDINTIKEKYNLTYVHTTGNDMWYDYRCYVNNVEQVMSLAEEIQNEESVEWTVICRLGDGWIGDGSPMSESDDSEMLTPLYSPNDINWYDNERHYETIGEWGWQVLVDETGRCWGGYFWDTPDGIPEPLEKLYAAPSSIDDLNGLLYTIDDNYELRLYKTESYTPDAAGFPRRGEAYLEYYKGVRVYEGRYYYQFSTSPKGDRITNCSGTIITFDSLDVVPTLTPQQALDIFSAYQKEPVDPSWECLLHVREYNIGNYDDGLIRREHRLVYIVLGPEYEYRNWDNWDNMPHKTRIRAEIDAKTGQIILIGSGFYI